MRATILSLMLKIRYGNILCAHNEISLATNFYIDIRVLLQIRPNKHIIHVDLALPHSCLSKL